MNNATEPKKKLSMAEMTAQAEARAEAATKKLAALEVRKAAEAKARAKAEAKANLPRGEELQKIAQAALEGCRKLGGGL